MTYVPDGKCTCYRCIFEEIPDPSSVQNCSQAGVIGAMAGIIGSVQALEAVMRARELLQTLTPLRRDSGDVCGAACCAPDEDGLGGMLRVPGEEARYQPLPAGFSLRQDDGVLPGMLEMANGHFLRGI